MFDNEKKACITIVVKVRRIKEIIDYK